MNDWPILSFADAPIQIVDGDRGANYPTQTEFSTNGHCLFLNAGNVTKVGFDFSSTQFISRERDEKLRKGKLQRLDCVLTTRGTVGNVAFFDNNIRFENLRINSGMVIFRPDPELVVPRYLYMFLRSKMFSLQVEALTSGSAQPQLPIRDINRIEISLPKPPEQERIVETLGSLDDKIELNRWMNETLEALAQAIFKDWFVDFGPTRRKAEGATDPVAILGNLIPDKTRAQKTATLFPATFGDDGLPEGWAMGNLDKIALASSSTIDPTSIDPSTPYIGLEHMPRKSIMLDDWGQSGSVTSNKTKFEKGQILFGKLRPYFHKVGIAPVDGVSSTDIIVLDAKRVTDRPLVVCCVSTDHFVAFTDQGSDGTKMPRTSWSKMKQYSVALSPEPVTCSPELTSFES
jgi:type I restriction enzyme, S subunit